MHKICQKKLNQEKLWTFKWPKVDNIFINPHHNHPKNDCDMNL